MAQQHFGDRLAEARRQRGLTLDQVHGQLRITPAILDFLERADFHHMPLKGHARNMVSAYARFLGLDSNEITKQFLKEYHDFENHIMREKNRSNVFLGYRNIGAGSGSIEGRSVSMQGVNRTENSQGINSMWNKPIPKSELSQRQAPQAAGADMTSRRENFDRGNALTRGESTNRAGATSAQPGGQNLGHKAASPSQYGSAAQRGSYRPAKVGTGMAGRQSVAGSGGAGASPMGSRRRVTGAEGYNSDRIKAQRSSIGVATTVDTTIGGSRLDLGRSDSSFGSGSYGTKPSLPMRLFGSLFNNPIALVIALVLVLVLLFVVWAVAANSCQAADKDADSPTIAGSVVSDGTTTPTPSGETPPANNNPAVEGSFILTVEPVGDPAPYTEITVDDVVVFAEAPLTEKMSFTVTKNCKVGTGLIGNLKLSKDDVAMPYEASGQGGWASNDYGYCTWTYTVGQQETAAQ